MNVKNKLLLSALGVCTALGALFSGCGITAPTSTEEESTELINPFVDCESIEAAQEVAGFLIDVPDDLREWGYRDSWIQAVDDYLIQVCYLNKDEQILIRKGVGEADVSGDHNVYDFTEETEIGGHTVKLSGNDGLIRLATWTDGGYAYSISSTYGMERLELEALLIEVR